MTATLKNVLCIDDEPNVLFVTQMCLETVGALTVTAVSSGREGLKSAAEAKPDVILLDAMMPEMDGPATLKALRLNLSLHDVPILLMTARVQPSEVVEYFAIGANGVIAKPYDPMTLSTQILTLWEKFHAKQPAASPN